MRTLPLSAYFGLYGTMLSTALAIVLTIQLDPAIPGPWNHPEFAWMLLAVVALPAAAGLAYTEANRRKRPDVDRVRYLAATMTAEPVGDVSAWPQWIWRDRLEARVLGIVSVVGALWWAVAAFRYGPWWACGSMALLAASGIWFAWRVQRNLRNLCQSLVARGDCIG
jgi:hypothetical protein